MKNGSTNTAFPYIYLGRHPYLRVTTHIIKAIRYLLHREPISTKLDSEINMLLSGIRCVDEDNIKSSFTSGARVPFLSNVMHVKSGVKSTTSKSSLESPL